MSLFSKTIIHFTIFILMVVFLSPQYGFSEAPVLDSKTIIVTGTGQVRKSDAASAREKAISESLITAIGIVMSDLTPSEILVPNFQSLNEILYTHTDRFINGYRVLAETKYKNRYRVLVQARISTLKIKEQLMEIGIMAGDVTKPKILLCIAEQNIGELMPRYWWNNESLDIENKAETILTEILTKKGFIITDHPDPASYSDIEDLLFEASEPDQDLIVNLAKLADADIVIVGKAFSEQTSNTMGEDIRSFKGTLQARAIRIEKENEIGKTTKNVTTVNTNEIFGSLEAISQATTLAGEDLAIQITSSYQKKSNEKSGIKIVIEGTRILSNFVKFRRALSSLQHVGEIRSSEMKANEATLIVQYKNNINQLAEALMTKSFTSFGINISKVLSDQLNVILVPIDQAHKPSKTDNIVNQVPEE